MDKSASFSVTVSSDELDLVEAGVQGLINGIIVGATFNFVAMNKMTYNKPDLDFSEQVLPNGVIVTVSPHPHNANNNECVVDFVFDFGAVVVADVISYDLELFARDVQEGYAQVNIDDTI